MNHPDFLSKLTREQFDTAWEMYDSGQPTRAIAEHFGIDDEDLRRSMVHGTTPEHQQQIRFERRIAQAKRELLWLQDSYDAKRKKSPGER